MKNRNAYLKEIKPNNKGRALLAVAILEDESVRLASESNSRAYLEMKDEQDKMPEWLWNVFWFITGILFMISTENVFWNAKDIIIK